MADEGKGKKRNRRPAKAAAAAASSRQRTLKDMFSGSSKASKSDVSEPQPVPGHVIELSDSEPDVIATQAPTPVETDGSAAVSTLTSLGSLTGEECVSPATMAVPESEPPKKLFPIFEKRKTRSSTQQKEQDDVVVSVAGLRLAKETASEVSSPEVDADLARSRSSSVQIQEVQSGPLATGSRRDAPIVIESSPEIKIVKLAPRPAKPVYSIFNHPARTVTIASRTVAPLPIPTPNKENQPDSVLMPLPTARARFPLRDKGKSREVEMSRRQEPLPGLPPISKYICSPQPTDIMRSRQNIDIHDHINMIPLAHQCIPSVSRLLQVARDDIRPDTFPSNEQWAECWRPRQADQVIGNEQHALYLRDWLQALRLQGESLRPANAAPLRKNQNKHKRKNKNKKPDVVRHVKRRRRDGREDDFFAPDDFTDSEDELGGLDDRFSDWDDIGFCVEMDARLNGSACSAGTSRGSSAGAATPDDEPAAQSYKPTRFGRQISNTILLAGPSGSGKTAAVYACAEELGWEVFEVYPGIGERSGAELNKLIGDVGKNHTVKVHQSPKKTNTKAAFFQKQAVQTKRKSNPRRVCDSEDELDLLRDSQDSQEVENETVDVIESSSPQPALEPTEPTVNQSVILIEEADILYHTDTNFWPALVNIIRHCRRPVVLTCNDVSLIPRDDLPLQATLEFHACPTQLATSYLQIVCLAERKPVIRKDVSRAFEESSGDLRHTLQHLQVWEDTSVRPAGGAEAFKEINIPQSSPESSPLTWTEKSRSASPPPASSGGAGVAGEARVLWQIERQHELHSFVDAWLARGSSTVPHGYFQDESLPNVDDPLGYTVLSCDMETDHIPVSPAHTQDMQLAEDVLGRLRQLEDTGVPPHADDPDSDRTAYLAQIGPLLRSFRAWTVPAADAALHLDYAPWLRHIVAVEEEQRAVFAQTEASGGSQRRRTRNSQRSEHSWLSLVAEERGLLATSGFST